MIKLLMIIIGIACYIGFLVGGAMAAVGDKGVIVASNYTPSKLSRAGLIVVVCSVIIGLAAMLIYSILTGQGANR